MASHRQWPLTAIQHDLSTLYQQLHEDMVALVHSDYADFIRLSIHVGGVKEQLEPWLLELQSIEQLLQVPSRSLGASHARAEGQDAGRWPPGVHPAKDAATGGHSFAAGIAANHQASTARTTVGKTAKEGALLRHFGPARERAGCRP